MQQLWDYRIPQPFSLYPVIVAEWNEDGGSTTNTTLAVQREALDVPGFLEYLVVM
jgi:hypothetical protein